MFPNGFGDPFGLNSGPVIVDSSSKVPCFTYVLLLAFLTTDKVDAVVSTAGHRSQNLIGENCNISCPQLKLTSIGCLKPKDYLDITFIKVYFIFRDF